jgi:hypothetical protein
MTLVPAACAVAFAVKGQGADCGSPIDMKTWLYVCAAVQLLNWCVALRTFLKFDMPYNPADPKDKDYVSRMNHMICYDPLIAFYLFVLMFQFAWQVVGHVVYSHIDEALCAKSVTYMADAAITLVWIFLALGCFSLVAGYLMEAVETRCCPQFLGSACGMCLECICPGLLGMFRRNDRQLPVTSTGGGPGLAPVVPMYLAPPGPPRPDYVPVVHAAQTRGGASYSAQPYVTGHGMPPHQRVAAPNAIPLAHVVAVPSGNVPVARLAHVGAAKY